MQAIIAWWTAGVGSVEVVEHRDIRIRLGAIEVSNSADQRPEKWLGYMEYKIIR